MDAPVAGKTLFRLKSVYKKIVEESTRYEHTRREIAERLCEVGEDGNKRKVEGKDGSIIYSFSNENKALLAKEIEELLTLDVPIGETFKFEEVEKANLSARDLVALEDFVVE